MAGILGYLAALADDISSLAGRTMAGATHNVAGSLDNTSVMLDDIATYTKVASAKSSGVVVDDLAAIANMANEATSSILIQEINKAHSMEELKSNIEHLDKKEKRLIAAQLEKLRELISTKAKQKAAARELPIVFKIAKGSLINKMIIIPMILIISAVMPWLMKPILIMGGLYLAYEGVESVLEKFFGHHEEHTTEETVQELNTEKFEDLKIKSAIKTDFILSMEIMVLALSLLQKADFLVKITTLFAVAIIATLGVYGLVGLIIKLDDIGFYLQSKANRIAKKAGDMFVAIVPPLIKSISAIGTIAMLAVGGGIIDHQTGTLHGIDNMVEQHLENISFLVLFLIEVIFGFIVGYAAVRIMLLLTWAKKKIIP
jgi:predicted DNA repair protein MutK